MKALQIIFKWINVLCFFTVTYFCAATLLLWYNFRIGIAPYQISVKVPLLGNSWLPAPLWFCVVISLVTIALAVICVYIRCRIGPFPVPVKNRAIIRLPNLKVSVEHKDINKRIKTVRNISFGLFMVSVILIAMPALTALLIESLSPLRVLLFDFMDRNIRNAALSAGYEPVTCLEISLLILQSVIHQCVLFLSACWFFCNLKRKPLLLPAAEK